MKKLTIIIALITVMGISFQSVVRAEATTATNIITSLGENASSEINVNFHADGIGGVVEYALGSDATFSNKVSVVSDCRTFSVDLLVSGSTTYGFTERQVCGASLTGLSANTNYRYRIKTGSSYSAVYTFKTAPVMGSTNFLFLTDPQFYSLSTAQAYNRLITEGLKRNPNIAFTMITGDITDRGGVEQQWNWFFEAGTNLNKMPLVTVPGNHEYYFDTGQYTSVDYYNAYFNNPKNGPEQYINSSYFFKYNNALFVMIDVVTGHYRNEQIAWFSEVVENNPAKYIIVGMHYGGFGSTYANVAEQILNSWGVVFDKYQVDMVLSGHDHFYGRTAPVYNKVPSAIEPFGTTYLVGGSAGPKTYNVTEAAKTKFEFTLVQANIGSIISLQGQNIVVTLISQEGVVLDTFNVPTKRPNTIVEVDNDTFMESLSLVQDIANNTARFEWDGTMGYGNVKKIEAIDLLNDRTQTFIQSIPAINLGSLGTLHLGTNHSYRVKVHFHSGEILEKSYEFSQKYGSGELVNLRVDEDSLMRDYAKILWEDPHDPIELDHYLVHLDGELLGRVELGVEFIDLTTLEKETTYEARVTGVDEFGDFVYEKTIFLTTNDRKHPWGSITEIKIDPLHITTESMKMEWTATIDSLGFGGFKVFLDDDLYDQLEAIQNECTISGLQENTEYQIRFEVVDIYGETTYEFSQTVKTKAVKISSGTISDFRLESNVKHNQATIIWNNSNVKEGLDYYLLFVNGVEQTDLSKESFEWKILDLKPNTRYTVSLKGIDLDGEIAFIEQLTFTTMENPVVVPAIIGSSVIGASGIATGLFFFLKKRRLG